MNGSTGVRGTPHELALLGGGPRAAVTVAVVALHLRGAVEAGAAGTLQAVDGDAARALPVLPPPGVPLDAAVTDGAVTNGQLHDGPATDGTVTDGRVADGLVAGGTGPAGPVDGELRARYLESAVYACLAEPSGIRELVRHPDVRWALAEVRVGLAEAGMLRYPLRLGPTAAARRRLRVLRTAFPLPANRRGLSDRDRLLAVALHGEAALRVLVPRFALRAGLTDRVRITEKDMLRHWPRGGSGGAGHTYCGGGGGCGGGGSE
ncbi:uncharacterized protein (TIGR04222 family) [Streptomyces calvus]|uniref:TIGR04222 domain-containing membrane protein n=1 Tax=Streptomyces calvus TaxID=67282 RepID=UPI003515DF83